MRSPSAWQTATLHQRIDLSPTVREFTLVPDGPAERWSPGSHLQVRVRIGERVDARHYSLVGLPEADGAYRIAVKRADAGRGGSRFMHALAEGARLEILPPANHFELSYAPPQHLLLAGGIGITPLVGMAQVLAAHGAEVRMAYAARRDDELVYVERLRALLGDRLQTFVGARGQRIDVDRLIAPLDPHAQLLLCGPLSLLQAAQAAWARAGRPPELLRYETFGAGTEAAEPFWVELPRHHLRLDVPVDRTLLQVLADAGVDTLSDCQRGECGLCAMDVLAVQGSIDHRDVFLSAAERAAGKRICACVSRVRGGGIVLDTDYRPDPLPPSAPQMA